MNYVLLSLLLILQYLDGMTTYRLLSNGGKELNPVVRWILNKLGLVWGLITLKGGLAVALVVATFANTMPWWLLAMLCIMYIVVVVHNFKELNK